jgi:hypothetical protein
MRELSQSIKQDPSDYVKLETHHSYPAGFRATYEISKHIKYLSRLAKGR